MSRAKVRERIYLNKKELETMELDILNRRHVERYALLRQWMWGNVIDVACGCGYGTNLVSKNPDIKKIIGVDIDKDAIQWANKNFATENCSFINSSIEKYKSKADVLISLETIEHLQNPNVLNELAERGEVKEIFVSYPSKKTTHYNKFHYHDFVDSDLQKIFKNFKLVDTIDLHKEVRILKLKKNV